MNTPAIGRSASAAWAEVWMSVMPCAFKVAAVADDDEQADHVRVAHPDIGIEAHPRDLRRRLLRRLEQRVRGGIDPLVLGLLRGLPEEAVGRDRRAQHRDHGDDVVRAQREIRHEGAIERPAPRARAPPARPPHRRAARSWSISGWRRSARSGRTPPAARSRWRSRRHRGRPGRRSAASAPRPSRRDRRRD